MAKGTGGTRSVGSGSAASWRSVSGGTFSVASQSGLSGIEKRSSDMKAALSQFGKENGYKQGLGNSIWKETNNNDNIQAYSISVIESYNGDRTGTIQFETRLTSAKSAVYGSKDFDQFQKEFFGGNERRYNSLSEAQKGLREQIKKLNKLKIS